MTPISQSDGFGGKSLFPGYLVRIEHEQDPNTLRTGESAATAPAMVCDHSAQLRRASTVCCDDLQPVDFASPITWLAFQSLFKQFAVRLDIVGCHNFDSNRHDQVSSPCVLLIALDYELLLSTLLNVFPECRNVARLYLFRVM
jgi:hypothetical protein